MGAAWDVLGHLLQKNAWQPEWRQAAILLALLIKDEGKALEQANALSLRFFADHKLRVSIENFILNASLAVLWHYPSAARISSLQQEYRYLNQAVTLRAHEDALLKALMLSLPSEADILEMVDAADPGHIHSVREFVLNGLAQALRGEWHEAYDLNQTRSYQPADGGRRSLKNLALAMLTRLSDAWPLEAAEKQCLEADNMTDQMGAMLALRDRDVAERENCYLSMSLINI